MRVGGDCIPKTCRAHSPGMSIESSHEDAINFSRLGSAPLPSRHCEYLPLFSFPNRHDLPLPWVRDNEDSCESSSSPFFVYAVGISQQL